MLDRIYLRLSLSLLSWWRMFLYLKANSSTDSKGFCFMALNSEARQRHFKSAGSWNSLRKLVMKHSNCSSGVFSANPSVLWQNDSAERGHSPIHCCSRSNRRTVTGSWAVCSWKWSRKSAISSWTYVFWRNVGNWSVGRQRLAMPVEGTVRFSGEVACDPVFVQCERLEWRQQIPWQFHLNQQRRLEFHR